MSGHAQASGVIPAGILAVDSHAHVMRRNASLIAERHSQPPRDVFVEEFLGVLDANGLARGVLTAPSFYGADNSILLDALRRHPDRLRGTAIVDPDAEPNLDALAAQGVVGIRLNWLRRARLPDIGSAGYRRLFDAVRARDWHVEVFLEGEKMPDVLPVIQASGARWVLAHFACPDPAGGIDSPGFRLALAAVRDGNCWVKLSAPYRLRGADPRPYVDALMQAGGPERLVWASDWPWVGHESGVSYPACLDALRAWVPDSAARATILADTPNRLFGF
jgi:predicted TIM-barrel fold metal-dependent hydrolase